MRCKQQDFLQLQQGSHNVFVYSKIFNYLVQYSVLHVDTNGKKAELFRKGLSAQLQDRVDLFHELTYNALASAAINQEGTIGAYSDVEKKRKRVMSGPSGGGSRGAPPKYRLVYTPLVG
jgi:hypothetical protein